MSSVNVEQFNIFMLNKSIIVFIVPKSLLTLSFINIYEHNQVILTNHPAAKTYKNRPRHMSNNELNGF